MINICVSFSVFASIEYISFFAISNSGLSLVHLRCFLKYFVCWQNEMSFINENYMVYVIIYYKLFFKLKIKLISTVIITYIISYFFKIKFISKFIKHKTFLCGEKNEP